jgi:hypothetical protein
MTLKSTIYQMLRLSNDLNAIRKGKAAKRLRNKAIGRIAGRLMR